MIEEFFHIVRTVNRNHKQPDRSNLQQTSQGFSRAIPIIYFSDICQFCLYQMICVPFYLNLSNAVCTSIEQFRFFSGSFKGRLAWHSICQEREELFVTLL